MLQILVLELLGPSLQHIIKTLKNERITFQSISFLGQQIIKRIQYLHSNSLLHRNINPNHILFGTGSMRVRFHLFQKLKLLLIFFLILECSSFDRF